MSGAGEGGGSRDVIAIDWIEQFGGAEKVVDRFAEVLQDADVLTLWSDAPERYRGHRLTESWLAGTPLRRHKALAIPVLSRTWRGFDATGYERAVVSSHAFAHHFGSGPRQRHLERFVYVHSPARWIWARDLDPRGSSRLARPAVEALKRHDRRRAGRGHYAVNSRFIASRVEQAWGLPSSVIYPPVDTEALRGPGPWRDLLDAREADLVDGLPDVFVLGASRFVDYKRLDLVVRFAERNDVPVVLAGSGHASPRLQQAMAEAHVPVTLVERPGDALLRALMQRAALYVYPPVEDFGIMPVEAYALGTPAVVNRVGGATEAAELTGGGLAISFDDVASWPAAFAQATALPAGFDARADEIFSHARFDAEVRTWLEPGR